MGIDINRFPNEVDEELKCSICLNVLERPVHGSCGHVFCRTCIILWLDSQRSRSSDEYVRVSSRFSRPGTCPVDRTELRIEDLVDAALPFRTFISRLTIKCDNEAFGCKSIMQLGQLKDHLHNCNFNPDEEIECQNGCKSVLPRKYLVRDHHNCIREMRKIIKKQEKDINRLKNYVVTMREGKQRWSRICAWLGALLAVILIMFFPSANDSQNIAII
ncbi:E3 ubiquitin-protein ligase NRDP1 [Halotydeus destructor]|nr:E3 ubiquitin-protein ligase NRDP1 [Halotydeus destructor]